MIKLFALASLVLLSAACEAPGRSGPSPASSEARAAATAAPSPAPTARPAPAASAAPSPSASAAPAAAFEGHCVAEIDAKTRARVNLRSVAHGGKGVVEVEGPEPRKLKVEVALHKATSVLLFDGYGKGDATPKGEKLTAGKSQVARLVTVSDREDLYFDGDVKPAGLGAPGKALVCVPSEAPPAEPECKTAKDCAPSEVCVHAQGPEGKVGSFFCADRVLSGNGQGVACVTDADCQDARLSKIGDIKDWAKGERLSCQKHGETASKICNKP